LKITYILDTNICIYIAKKKPVEVLNKFEELAIGEVGMSVVTHAELLYGAKRSQQPQKSMAMLEELISLIPVQPLHDDVATH